MAGLYITTGATTAKALDAVAAYMRFSDEAERRLESEFSYVWLSHDDPERFAPAMDRRTGVQCVAAGRINWPTATWDSAARLPFEGGTANRVLLERYLNGGAKRVAPYNGAAVVTIWDPRVRQIHVWTDQFGYHPAFFYGPSPKQPLAFTTFPDALSADAAIELRPDHVSMAEFLRAWRVTPPHTYYRDVKHAGAATHTQWDVATGTAVAQQYWRPFEQRFFATQQEAGEALADALRASVAERTSISRKSAFFVSGGADSRVMLYAATDPSRVSGINLYETPTHESAVAKALCERVGAQYVGFGRDNDYYPRMQRDNVRWSGAMWSIEDNHYLGVHKIVKELGADLVMTACTTDWVFKGYGLEKKHRTLIGRNLPLKDFTDERVDGFLPNRPGAAPAQHAEEINDRMAGWFGGYPTHLKTDVERLLVEDRRIRPTCYTVSVSGQIMFRTYPYDSFLADSRVADCYARIPAAWKLNGEVWGLAAGKVCERAADIVDSNFGWRVNASASAKLAAFARGWLKRRIVRPQAQQASDVRPPSHASWPQMGWYASHSMRLRDFWESTSPDARARMTDIYGSDPWSRPLAEWAGRPDDLMRILTLLQHWKLHPQQLAAA
jgi:hypothetical protein